MNSFQAAELQAIAGVGMTHALNEIAAAFESSTGRRIAFRFGTTPELIRLATSGDPFDLGIVPRDVLEDAATRAQFAPGATLDIARVGIGVAVRRGAARPDIGTLEALKQALLAAQSVASIPASATGTQLADVYERLGITEAMNTRTKAQLGPSQLVAAVASGDAELAVFLLNVIAHPRLDVIGPFPAEVQREVVYTAGVAADAREPEAAKAFIAYLRTPPAAAAIKSKGLTPG
ncbi:MAG TPA: substrate-binding domain-containing protein [Hyphomicrobiaceae bacterium]|jgi:molybdate transport system substrate-binding protein|nr:substrate-binding domain-containing protein [Hyphomicrobiaceae bacterium]